MPFWILAACLVVGGAARTLKPAAPKRLLQWEAHTLANIPDGYQVAVVDVNGDGRPDIVAVGASTGNLVGTRIGV